MKRSWYSDMQIIGRATGWGMRDVIQAIRAVNDERARRRMKTVEGEPIAHGSGSGWLHVPIINKRSGKVVCYRMVHKTWLVADGQV